MNRNSIHEQYGRSTAASCVSFLVLTLLLFGTFTAANAQTDDLETAPPPVALASKAEREKLGTAKDARDRTKLALEIMDLRLRSAERSMAENNFIGLYSELGFFQGVLADQLEFMTRSRNPGGRVLDSFKRLEIGLRAFSPRIESIRRELPLKYEPYVRSLGKYIRDARSRALEPLFSDSVVQLPQNP